MGMPRNRSKTKNPPILSHEFVIQNHADIVSCIAMVFVVGLMFQLTAPISSTFIAMQHNVTADIEEGPDGAGGTDTDPAAGGPGPHVTEVWHYTYGSKDLCAVFFYLLITIVMHAVVQEYVLDKLNRKMHLSKVKNSKFNESGQLLVFYVISVAWGADLIYNANYVTNISALWEGYPHSEMTFSYKLFFILQMSYWLHCFPELYFQKIKREEMGARIQYALLYFGIISAAYFLNYTRIALCLIVMHYSVECVFHLARLLYFSEKFEIANSCFMMWNVLFVLVRLGSITLSVLTFWYGLEKTTSPAIDFSTGNFNIQLIRINSLVAVGLNQAWLMWNFICFHLKRAREQSAAAAAASARQLRERAATQKAGSKKKQRRQQEEEDVNDLPEVDQSQLRARKIGRKQTAT